LNRSNNPLPAAQDNDARNNLYTVLCDKDPRHLYAILRDIT